MMYIIVLYCTLLVLYCIVLYCTVLHCSTPPPGINQFAVNNNKITIIISKLKGVPIRAQDLIF